MIRFLLLGCCFLLCCSSANAQIPIPKDAPKPLSPKESAASVKLPEGFQLELLASEPLVRNPSGVCWDQKGRCFVCELHGYNMEGQFDIEELNKTGKLDKVVRRLPAPKHAQEKAEKVQTGTVKLLFDTDNDGHMDKAKVWADDLPACFGVVPARNGVIVICSPDIVYLADNDGDDEVDQRLVLFSGFNTGILERRMNAPKWGLDNWIYVGRGQGGKIKGPFLKELVNLPANDFRFKADGSAIEPIPDGTHTFGFAFSATGDRYVISTGSPAIYVAPIPWRYLARNPFFSPGSMRVDVGPGNKAFPISKPHPWRSRRAEDPGFEKYYRSRYGSAESTPNGFFTSACSPFVYQDFALPDLKGNLLACEPAQNLVHRSEITRNGLVPKLRRKPSEKESEFLASKDIWFHPMALRHAPDGSIAIVDFYREIIEDYSAIPRYLQQQYRLNHGEDHGRIWKLTHKDMSRPTDDDMVKLSGVQLVQNLESHRYWRRKTAQRLLVERLGAGEVELIKVFLADASHVEARIAALHILDEINKLTTKDLETALRGEIPGLVVEALRLADRRFDKERTLLDAALGLVTHKSPRVQLQLALSLGETDDLAAKEALAELVLNHGDVPWLRDAVLTSLKTGGDQFVREFLKNPLAKKKKESRQFLQNLCSILANSRDAKILSKTIEHLSESNADTALIESCLVGFRSAYSKPRPTQLSSRAKKALKQLAENRQKGLKQQARALIVLMRIESAVERQERLARAHQLVTNFQATVSDRKSAVDELAAEKDVETIRLLFSSFSSSTPAIRNAILSAAFSQKEFIEVIVESIENNKISLSSLSGIQRESLLATSNRNLKLRVEKLIAKFNATSKVDVSAYTKALSGDRNLENGSAVFRKHCANCHQTHGIGFAVGPDLASEFRRSEETFVQDIVLPSHSISAGYESYNVETIDGLMVNGLLAFESPTGIVLRQAEGKQQTILRKDIEKIRSVNISMMPENLATTLKPKDVADVIAWIRRPSQNRVLFDDDPGFLRKLSDGGGTASIEHNDRHKGTISLRISPPQKYSVRIENWNFRIRENPKLGEYRFIRFAWKAKNAKGALIEIANNGSWPSSGSPKFRYYSGENTTEWQATRVNKEAPSEWVVVTRDLWKDFGDSNITGIAPTAMGGDVLFDSIELLRKRE